MLKRNKLSTKQGLKWSAKKPLTQGRFWWVSDELNPPKLVYVEKQSLGLYVIGVGWLPYQAGQWAGPVGQQNPAANN